MWPAGPNTHGIKNILFWSESGKALVTSLSSPWTAPCVAAGVEGVFSSWLLLSQAGAGSGDADWRLFCSCTEWPFQGAVEKLGGFCDLASEVSKCDWSYHFLVKQTAVGQGRFKTHGKVESLQQRLYGIQIVNPSLSSFSQKMFAKRCYIDPPIKHLS